MKNFSSYNLSVTGINFSKNFKILLSEKSFDLSLLNNIFKPLKNKKKPNI